MQKIQSFQIDHDVLDPGIYVSRIDGDITTYDLRTRKPNSGDVMDNVTMHSVEHMIATFVRNSSIADRVIYFGPMGCQTGFYLLVRHADNAEVLAALEGYTGKNEVFIDEKSYRCGDSTFERIAKESEQTNLYAKLTRHIHCAGITAAQFGDILMHRLGNQPRKIDTPDKIACDCNQHKLPPIVQN